MKDLSSKAQPLIVLLLLHTFFFGVFILTVSQSGRYTLRGFWQWLPAPLLILVLLICSLKILNQIQVRWQKILIWLIHGTGAFFSWLYCCGFFTIALSGIVSPRHYVNYPSPSEQRSVTIVSHNITCTQQVYLNRGLIMQSVGSFNIGTGKCLDSARAQIQWQPGETAIVWRYHDRQGVIQLPID